MPKGYISEESLLASLTPTQDKAIQQKLRGQKPWAPLKPGDTVDLVAPGSACKSSELRMGIRFLQTLGLIPRVPKGLFKEHPLFSNTDQFRFEHLRDSLLATDSKAIWCVRGGYGALRLLPALEKIKVPQQSKIFMGYSDITTVHTFLNQKWKWPTLHSPLLDRMARGDHKPSDIKRLRKILFGEGRTLEFDSLWPLNQPAKKAKVIVAPIAGGNLTVLCSSLGTCWQPQMKDRIIFFEDIGERPHRVDRMLVQLQLADFFKGASAVVFGDMLNEKKSDSHLLWSDVISRFADEVKLPVFRGLPVGHGRVQRTLPFLTAAKIEISSRQASLFVDTGVR